MTTRLSDVVGHARALEALRRALGRGAVHSGYLFCGPAGVGKRLAAEAFAGAFLCAAGAAEACGGCPSCARIAARTHADLERVEPREDRKSISIEQVRDLGAWLALAPSAGRRKAAILDPADAMTAEAQNALLKTLEEPPPGRVIILVSARPGALAATVLSRCQRVFFGALSGAEVAAVLRGKGWPAEAAARGAAFAEGSPGAALARDGKGWQDAAAVAGALLEALGRRDPGAGLAVAEGLREGREGAQAALQVLLGWLREEARGRLGAPAAAAAAPDPGALAELGSAELPRLMERILDAQRRLEANANPRIAVAALALGVDAAGR